MLCEDLTQGQSITSFRVYGYLPAYQKVKILLFEGKTVGHKIYCRFSPLRVSQFEVEVTGHDGDYTITDMQAYYVK